MPRPSVWFLALAPAAALAGLAPADARADAFALLENGQEIEGDLPPGEDVRIEIVLAKGSKPNFRLALRGAGHGEAGRVKISGPEAGPGKPGGLRRPRNAFRRTSSTTLLSAGSP